MSVIAIDTKTACMLIDTFAHVCDMSLRMAALQLGKMKVCAPVENDQQDPELAQKAREVVKNASTDYVDYEQNAVLAYSQMVRVFNELSKTITQEHAPKPTTTGSA